MFFFFLLWYYMCFMQQLIKYWNCEWRTRNNLPQITEVVGCLRVIILNYHCTSISQYDLGGCFHGITRCVLAAVGTKGSSRRIVFRHRTYSYLLRHHSCRDESGNLLHLLHSRDTLTILSPWSSSLMKWKFPWVLLTYLGDFPCYASASIWEAESKEWN